MQGENNAAMESLLYSNRGNAVDNYEIEMPAGG